jgi:hypothetical protein
VAALHRKIANQRRDFLHQTSAWLIGLIGLSVTKRLVIQSMTCGPQKLWPWYLWGDDYTMPICRDLAPSL